MSDIDRIARYTERRFLKSGKTTWPRVADVARALRIKQSAIAEAADDPCGPIMLTEYYSTPAFKLGEKWVEVSHDHHPGR